MPTRQRRSKPEKRDPLIALRIPPELDDRLRAFVEQEGSTISDYVRGCIERSLTRRAGPAAGITEGKPHPTAAKRPQRQRAAPAAMCEHRIRAGNYCARCKALIA